MSSKREKELYLLIYEQDQIIKEAKKIKKKYVDELNYLQGKKKVKYDRRKH